MNLKKALGAAWLAGAMIAAPSLALAAQPEARPAAVMRIMERVADWQIAHPIPNARVGQRDPRGWEQGAYYVGLTELAQRSASPRFREAVFARGKANEWQLGRRLYHADDHVIGESYIWAARHGGGEAVIAPLRKTFDAVLAKPSTVSLEYIDRPGGPACLDRWCWSDALFMAPPTFFGLSQLTGDRRYADFADAEFRATTAYLYDPTESLYFRDSRFFDRRGANGEKVFWSRGNGWSYAGIVRVLQTMPKDDPRRWLYERIFKDMSAKLKTIQKDDGYWSPSLLAGVQTTPAESSGTGFFVYGMAWGVKAGLLDRKDYEPAIRKGWAALTRAVQPDGMLGWVQQVSDRPEEVAAQDTQFYGVGAFLLAGSAVHDLKLR